MMERLSDNETSRRDIPSFIEPRPPLINNPFMRPRPQKGTNLLELFEEDSEIEEPELVQVYLRMKPHEVPNNLYEVRTDKCLVTSLDTTTAGHGRRTQHNVSRMYTFSRIFDSQCSQKEIFDQVVKENLKKLPEGHNFTLLTYGASGSGKTYTLMGTVNSPGLVPRSLEYVFKLVDASQMPTYKPSDGGADMLGYSQQEFELQWVKRLRQVSAPQRDKYHRMSAQLKSDLTISNFDLTNKTKHYVWVSFVEIYNEAIYDLLAPPDKRTKLRIREDSTGQVYVKGVKQAFVRTGLEAYDVMVAGKHNLVVAATGVHAQSSRSHCIFTITMLTETDGEIRTSCIRLCDLAGCERARATRNTGTRMQESRAINSSLHVLERCLHMLRRNQKQRQEALVPYRESKLTRLLGSGLSGSRGEAVSMVVTLNPAPQYAHETKHVLSLAAVAQDIQINNTVMFASSLDSTAQDTTIASSAELMKLRSDNELLHFELIQAQARNKELLALMEEEKAENANTMRKIMEEAQDTMRQFYEERLNALKNEKDDLIEEYEAILAKTAEPPESTGTPNRFLQAKVAQLMTEITVLQNKLSEEELARARAEEEVKHLRTCIDDRDEKTDKESEPENQDMVLTDSDDDTSDPFNQSLEPVFRKECIIRSQAKTDNEIVITMKQNNEETPVIEGQSDIDKSSDTVNQDYDNDSSRNSDYATGDESEVKAVDESEIKHLAVSQTNTIDAVNLTNISDTVKLTNIIDAVNLTNKINAVNLTDTNSAKHDIKEVCSKIFQKRIDDQSYYEAKNVTGEFVDSNISDVRGTYFVSDQKDNGPNESVEVENKVRGTYFVSKSAIDMSSDEEIENEVNKEESEKFESEKSRETYFVRKSAIDSSCDEEIKKDENNQEAQLLNTQDTKKSDTKEARGTYFVKMSAIYISSDEENDEKVNHESELFSKPEEAIETHFVRTSAIATSVDEEIKVIVEDKPVSVSKNKVIDTPESKELKNESETLVSRIINSLKKTTHSNVSDSSLRQFEQLEIAFRERGNESTKGNSTFGDIKIIKEKRTFFDENAKDTDKLHITVKTDASETFISSNKTKDTVEEKHNAKEKVENAISSCNNLEKNIDFEENKFDPDKNGVFTNEYLISKLVTEKRTYFDNTEVSTGTISNKMVADLITSSRKNYEISPSIVLDDIGKPYEPSTIKKLLGENIAKLEVLSSINKPLVKKHDSIDIFEGLESPQVKATGKEEVATLVTKTTNVSTLDDVRKSIEKLVLEQKSRNDTRQEKLETISSAEEEILIKQTQNSVPAVIDKKRTTEFVLVQLAENESKQDSTIEEFENIYKNLSAQRPTEFNLLIETTQEINANDKDETEIDETKVELTKTDKDIVKEKVEETKPLESEKVLTYNLRHKGKSVLNVPDNKKDKEEEVFSSKKYTKRSLRLRRRKNDEESFDHDSDVLKDILNLKKEFSDVTLGLPASKKEVKDIPSPEKLTDDNLPPLMGIQSCPSKSVTRSRRKLFTPCAEPLEESLSQAGDSNERVCVPRPSYHRARARRKL